MKLKLLNNHFNSMIKQFKKYQHIFFVFFIIKIIFILLILSLNQFIKPSDTTNYKKSFIFTEQKSIINYKFASFDGQRYLKIALKGYKQIVRERTSKDIYAFFPLYPILIKTFSPLFGGSMAWSGLTLSILFYLFGTIYLYKLILELYSKSVALKTILLFLVFPSTIFYTAIYTESLFFMLMVMTFYYLNKRRWWIVGWLGALASLSRPQGCLLLAPVLIEYYFYLKNLKPYSIKNLIEKTKYNFIAPFIIPLGLVIFLTYSKLKTGNFFTPIIVQQYWGRETTGILNIFIVLFTEIKNFFALPIHSLAHSKIDSTISLVYILSLCFFARLKIPISYIIYATLLILVPLSTGSTMSMVRLSSYSFVHLIFFVLLSEKYKFIYSMIFLIFSFVSIYIGSLFINGYWAG